jgi:hypothetical protein
VDDRVNTTAVAVGAPRRGTVAPIDESGDLSDAAGDRLLARTLAAPPLLPLIHIPGTEPSARSIDGIVRTTVSAASR